MFKLKFVKREEAEEAGSVDWGAMADLSDNIDLDSGENIRDAAEAPIVQNDQPVEGSEAAEEALPGDAPVVESRSIEESLADEDAPKTEEVTAPEVNPVVDEFPVGFEKPLAETELTGPTEQQRQAARANALPQLEALYKPSEAEARDLEDNPAEVLPKMFARMHMDLTETVINSVVRQIPVLMQRANSKKEATSSVEKVFFDRWKELDTPEGRKTVNSYRKVFLQTNPGMTKGEYVNTVGAAAMVAMRLPIPGMAPEAPAAEPSGRKRVTSPALPGSSSANRSTERVSDNPFDALAMEIEDFEDY